MRRSRTSWVTSGWREPTTCAYLVRSAVMVRVVNWASTCENQSAGSLVQYGGSLMLTTEVTASGGVACVAEWSEVEVVAEELASCCCCCIVRGHQFSV